eukprot:s2335_g8.t1
MTSGRQSWIFCSAMLCLQYRSVKAKPVAGLQLRSLFPNLEKDEAPSPRVLQSVSALVVSKAAGPLSRRALSRSNDNSGSAGDQVKAFGSLKV